MSVFFNGSLLVTPTTASVVDDSAMANQNLSVGNVLALIGTSTGGQPNTLLTFGSPSDAQKALVSGELLDAVLKAFDASAQTGAPQSVQCVRVNPASQSTLSLLDASANPVITLASRDYGLYTGQIAVKVEAGTTTGKKVTTSFGTSYYVADNIARNAFKVRYTGGLASAVMTVSGTSITLQAPSGTNVATIDLSVYPTVQQVVDRINVVSGFTASVQDGNGAQPALNGLDYVTAQDIKTADYIATANLQAIVDWFNSEAEPLVTATRVAGRGALPANIAFTYLSGGSDGVVTNTEWSNAFTTLQSADVQWVVPLSSNASIHAMASSHVSFMASRKRERRAIVGPAVGTTDDAAIQAAKDLNSDRVSLVHLGHYAYNSAGVLTLYPPYMTAALLGGMFTGVNPGTALTNKTVKCAGLERNLRNPTDTDTLINGGVLCLENTPTGYKVVKSISTWLTNDNYYRVEQSVGVAMDYTVRSLRDALDVLRGEKGTPLLLARAKSLAQTTLTELARAEPAGPGVLAGDDANPAFKNLQVSLAGDVLRVSVQASPVIPANYILLTVYAVPYSGSASV